jgi:hypothetical protein
MKSATLLSMCLITGIILAGCGAGAPVNTATPAYTPTPPNTTTADLTKVSLKTEDLPVGFHRFTEDEIKTSGIDLTSMFKSFGSGANLVKEDLYGKNLTTVAFLFDVLVYPLSSDVIGQTDQTFKNPESAIQSNDTLKSFSVLPNLNAIGNGSMGLSGITKGINMNLLMIRRNNTLIILLEMYQGNTSNFDLKVVGQKMDQYVLAEYK